MKIFWTKAAFNSENTSLLQYAFENSMALEEKGNLDRAVEYYTTIQKNFLILKKQEILTNS